MQDIANMAGVSRSTVSFALSGQKLKNGDIPRETRDRIIAAAKKLGYKRNELACSVRRGYSKTIAYLVGGADYSFSLPLIIGVSSTVQARGYFFKLLMLNHDLDLQSALSQCASQMVAGVICGNIQHDKLDMLRHELEPLGMPIVLADNNVPHDWCLSVTSDEVAGAKMAAEHLLKLGHRRLGMISYGLPGCPDQINQSPSNILRRKGFLEALTQAGLQHEPHMEMRDAEPEGKKVPAIAHFLKEAKPTAVFCVTDYLAAETLRAAYSIGLRVPQNLSVVGYGDLEVARYNNPPITSILQPFEDIGASAAGALLDRIEGKESNPAQNIILPVHLVKRESSAKLFREN